jgi:hypothetical protein
MSGLRSPRLAGALRVAEALVSYSPLDLASADSVVQTLEEAARASLTAACRKAALDVVHAPGRLIATGDLHDNPTALARLIEVAGLSGEADQPSDDPPVHITLHEIIHSDRLINGMDFSYRALVRVADLKRRFPERVHVLLGNHELSQVVGAGIVKDGIKVVEAFNAGVEYAFGAETPRVNEAISKFVRAMPLGLRCVTPHGDILCAHSVPAPAMMGRFDPSILLRDLTDADYEPRKGAAHLMVWGRQYDAEQLEDLVERWGVSMFILGHEKAENGVKFVPPCAIVLNSDHDKGVYLPIDLAHPPRAIDAVKDVVWLQSGMS